MAKSPFFHSLNDPVIQRFIETIEKTISSNPIVLSSSIQKYIGPNNNTAYLKGSILFIDSSSLDIAVFAKETNKVFSVEKYRFHYMDNKGRMLFRYDNAPHHRELSSFPNHKHTGSNAVSSSPRELKDILNEITAMILKK